MDLLTEETNSFCSSMAMEFVRRNKMKTLQPVLLNSTEFNVWSHQTKKHKVFEYVCAEVFINCGTVYTQFESGLCILGVMHNCGTCFVMLLIFEVCHITDWRSVVGVYLLIMLSNVFLCLLLIFCQCDKVYYDVGTVVQHCSTDGASQNCLKRYLRLVFVGSGLDCYTH